MVRIVDGDVLEDRGLAQRHEEAEHEHRHRERHEVHFEVERPRAVDRVHDVVGRRVGQHECARDRDEEGPVHHPPGPVGVRQMAAIGAEDAGREREGRGDHAGALDIEAVDVDEILRQPQGERDEGAEHEEVVEREPPHLGVLERLELEPRAPRLLAAGAPRAVDRVIFGGEPEHDRHHGDGGRPDLRDRMPAPGDEHERRKELGDRRTDIAGAENAERGALLRGRIPLRHIGDADREGPARDADEQGGDEELRISVRPGQEPGRHRRREHHRDIDDPAAILVGPDAEENANQRAAQDRRADQEAELRLVEAELLLDLHADDRKNRPHGEAHRERDGRHPESAALPGGRWRERLVHREPRDVSFARSRTARAHNASRSTGCDCDRSIRCRHLVEAENRLELYFAKSQNDYCFIIN